MNKLLLFAFLILFCNGYYGDEIYYPNKNWWKGARFYQIYPRSFMDSDNDGLGDINGITMKLDYVRDIGFDGIWLSPIFKSPMADHGYDISDFRAIDERFGTMEDFDRLLAKCNQYKIHLILDFVPNHSSDEHEWFQKSENRTPGYENFYIWHPGKYNSSTKKYDPPNNWISAFRYSAWQWSSIRKEFYYHKFHRKQPDLNYRNPKVVEEMDNVLLFWLKKGVSGFRVDAYPHLFEVEKDANGNYPDEPISQKPGCSPDDPCYLNYVYTKDRNETFYMIYHWRELLDNFTRDNRSYSKIMMAESFSSIDLVQRAYGENGLEGAHIPFNFELIYRLNVNSTAKDYKKAVDAWLDTMPEGRQANWVIGNHDRHRAASRLGKSRGDLVNIMMQTLPGITITYQGEELVLENVNLTWEETEDPAACATNPEIFHEVSRDPARTPFPWDDTINGGFSKSNKTWLPAGDQYKTNNVKFQLEAETSHLKIFRDLLKKPYDLEILIGDYRGALINEDNVFVYKRQLYPKTTIVILNLGQKTEIVDLRCPFPWVASKMEIATSSLGTKFVKG